MRKGFASRFTERRPLRTCAARHVPGPTPAHAPDAKTRGRRSLKRDAKNLRVRTVMRLILPKLHHRLDSKWS